MQFLQIGQSRNVERWSIAAGIFLFGLAAWAYLWISGQFPFYFIWDMDLPTVLDIIVMQSGLHPDHVNLPGFGMYLVLDLWIGLAKHLNWISAVDLDALANSMSPLACVAELTDCVRSLSPFIDLGFALFQGLALTFLLRIPAPLALLVFAVFLSQSSSLYHAAMNRTELYAMFFWGMGFCALAVAARNQARRAKALWILAAGVALGLAILTKLQVVLYVVALPFLFAFIQIAQGCRLADFWPGSWGRQDWGYRILAWANCIVFAALMTLAWFVEPPDGFWSFTDRYRPTAYAVLFMFIYMACPAGLTFLRGSRPALFGLLRFLTLLGTGLLGCSLFFFMILPRLGLSWQYLLVTYKMTFLRGALFAPKPIVAVAASRGRRENSSASQHIDWYSRERYSKDCTFNVETGIS